MVEWGRRWGGGLENSDYKGEGRLRKGEEERGLKKKQEARISSQCLQRLLEFL